MKTGFLCSAATLLLIPQMTFAEDVDCGLEYDVLPQECVQANNTTVVNMPAGANTEWDSGNVQTATGFVLSVDGKPTNADPRIEDQIRETDLALERADIRVTFDGLGADPRLDLEFRGGDADGYRPGDTAVLQSRLNYPAFVERAEMRIIDRGAPGGPRTVAVVPIEPNGQTSVVLPEGQDLVAVHRVYDSRGRYDETHPVALSYSDDRGLVQSVEEGTDNTARRRIPVSGGAVTVSSSNVPASATVRTLGEEVRPSPSGGFVIQRILPPGEHDVEVDVLNANYPYVVREVEIPKSEWFYVGVAEVTFGWRNDPPAGVDDTYNSGRISGYVDGKTAGGARVTVSVDTEEEELDEIFKRLDEKDPRSTLLRMDELSTYPVYGDDSSIVDNAPSRGRFYAKIEKDGNHLLWGDFKGRLDGNAFIRNERDLYGAQAVWGSQAQTEQGESRFALQLYASQPESLPGRDVFRGTGGSIYFLSNQDITIGTQTVTIEVRDAVTNRVIDRQVLQEGRDYSINNIQGTIVLSSPLSSMAAEGLIQSEQGGDQRINLVTQYEYTPTTSDVDGFSYGGRAEVWVTDNLRFGISATKDTTSTADQTSVGADILYNLGENSFARLDYAETDGPGFSSTFSTDGGLLLGTTPAAAGTGHAWNAELRADFADIGINADGFANFYLEKRTLGFSTLDHQVTAATGDEDLWGFHIEHRVSDGLSYVLRYDDYSNDVGDYSRQVGAQINVTANDKVKWSLAAEHLERKTGAITGDRTDIAARVDYQASDRLGVYAFGQVALESTGIDDNNRIGIGASYKVSDILSADVEISDGTTGVGGRALFTRRKDENSSQYFGYEMDPSRFATASSPLGDHDGQFILGGTRRVNDRLSVFGENTYDLFGVNNSLTSAYGLTYKSSDYLTYDGSIEVGRIQDSTNGDFDRHALSFGVSYQDETLTARARAEYRKDRGVLSGTGRDSETVLLSLDARHKISEEQRLLFSFNAVDTSGTSSIAGGDLVDFKLGYAYRPILNDRLNLLFSYRYLSDDYGQLLDGTDNGRLRQKSHVLSVDASYDLNEHWTLGGKLGYRVAESETGANSGVFDDNNAGLAVINARYHLVHKWDLLAEFRVLDSEGSQTRNTGFLAAAYRHVGNNAKIGVGYNFGRFSDDLTDLTQDDKGLFVNLIAKF